MANRWRPWFSNLVGSVCNIPMGQDRKKIGEEKLKNELYYLKNSPKQCFMSNNSIDQGMLMHQRFGHLSDKVLNQLFYYNLNSSNCDVCKFSEHTRLPFPLSSSMFEKAFDLITRMFGDLSPLNILLLLLMIIHVPPGSIC
ncbi:uncharacterized protein LOC125368574 isoform X2 [Ricinus communis]|uniref:uncharacterized protein LOC125368574 isoform X2 n=1 Tax=Ricinus communis TaxID=3988 RepID=UPI00201B0582|nr:uncharacterized protein LOC125368574 isoform X2 [Ricinus communis]